MVKIGEGKNKLRKKNVNFVEIGGMYKFCGNRGNWNMHYWLRGMDAPGFSVGY